MATLACPPAGWNRANPFSHAAIRELREETGVVASPSEITLAHTIHVRTENCSWIGHYFICQKWSGVAFLAEPDKHAELIWRNIATLPENTIPYVRQAIEAIQVGQRYSEFGWSSIG